MKRSRSQGANRKTRTASVEGIHAPPLLRSESPAEFQLFHEALEREINPQGVIERMYTRDFAAISWDIARLRRAKIVCINIGWRGGLQRVLTEVQGESAALTNDVETLSKDWFAEDGAKARVSSILSKYQLDDSAIEAQALRDAFRFLESIERMLASLEARRSKVLRSIADYRANFAKRRADTADRLLEGKDLPEIQDAPASQPESR